MNEQAATTSVTTDAADRDVDPDQPPSTAASASQTARPSDTALRVEVNLSAADVDPPILGWIDSHLARIADLAGVTEGRICLALVEDMEMSRLHERYKGVAGTTDVLTFDLRCRDDDPLDVDVVICRDEAARQATRRGHDTRMELLLYAVHGLLHVTGYDDVDQAHAQAMHAREDELLVRAGFPSIFADPGVGDPPLEVRETGRE